MTLLFLKTSAKYCTPISLISLYERYKSVIVYVTPKIVINNYIRQQNMLLCCCIIHQPMILLHCLH